MANTLNHTAAAAPVLVPSEGQVVSRSPLSAVAQDGLDALTAQQRVQRESVDLPSEFLRGCLQSNRRRQGSVCEICGEAIPIRDGMPERCCRIERGDFDLNNRTNDNIKFDVFICQKCFCEDADLCRFFNRLGLRVR